VIPLDNKSYDAVFSNLKGVWNGRENVKLETPGRAFVAGEQQRTSFLVMLWPGEIKSPDQLQSLADSYTSNTTATKLASGVKAKRVYRIQLAGKYGADATIVSSEQRYDPVPLVVHGVNARWTCGVEIDGSFRMAPSGISPMHTVIDLPQRPCRVVAGNILTADNNDLVIDLGAHGKKEIYFYAHNPTTKTLTTTVRSNSIFKTIPKISLQISLAPGEGRWFLANQK
jgi:hypothetical protein